MDYDRTLALRNTFVGKKGWKKSHKDNIALVENANRKIKMIFQSVDQVCNQFRESHLFHGKRQRIINWFISNSRKISFFRVVV